MGFLICRFYINHFQDSYRQAAVDVLQLGEVALESWVEINSLETLAGVASSLVPVGPPQYMALIATDKEKHLANAVFTFSRFLLFSVLELFAL